MSPSRLCLGDFLYLVYVTSCDAVTRGTAGLAKWREESGAKWREGQFAKVDRHVGIHIQSTYLKRNCI